MLTLFLTQERAYISTMNLHLHCVIFSFKKCLIQRGGGTSLTANECDVVGLLHANTTARWGVRTWRRKLQKDSQQIGSTCSVLIYYVLTHLWLGPHHTCMSERLLRAPTLTCQKPREPTPRVSHVQRQTTPSLMLVTVLTNVITQCKLHVLLFWVFISPFDMFRYLPSLYLEW
jgi:hypothetical protein